MTAKSIFSVNIYKTRINNMSLLDNIRLIARTLDLTGDHVSLQKSTVATARKNNQTLHKQEPFVQLAKYIEKESKIYWDQLGYYPDVHPKIWQSWLNVSNQDGYVSLHNHCRSSINAVLYISASPEQGNIIFENPLDLVLGAQPIKMPYAQFTHEVEVNTGDLLLFPGYLKHSTLPNTTDRDRIVYVADLNESGS